LVLTLVREGGRRKVARTFAQIGRASAHPEATGAASAAPPKGNEPLACAFTLSPSSHRACHIGDACLLICQPDVDILNFMRAGFCMPIFLLNEKVVALEFITRKEFEQPDPQAVQDAVIEADPERFLRAGLADDRCHGGRYVSADLFKEVFAQFGASKDSRNRYDTPVHNPAAVLSSEQFRRAVADGSEPKRDQVVFLTGVPGAGKTTSVSKDRKFPKDCRAIFDGQIPRPASIVTKMQALDAGSTPRIVAIHARPEKALESTRQRFDEYGRGAGIEMMAEMLAGLPDDLLAVQKHFGDKVKLHITDHRNRARPKVLTGRENLDLFRSERNHERVRQRLDDALEKHRPHLSEPAYRLDRQHDRPMDTGPGGYLQAPEQRRSLSQGSGQAPVLAPTRSPQERESQT